MTEGGEGTGQEQEGGAGGKKKQFLATLSPHLITELKQEAIGRGISASALLEKILEERRERKRRGE